MNYGAIGAVIGHEMGHGFDDQGREFDATGKVRNWWTPETNKKFLEQTSAACRAVQSLLPAEGVCVNGKLTMGENIGDLGGLEMAYTAYKLSLEWQGSAGHRRLHRRSALLHGARAGLARQERDDALRNQMLTNPHSPPAARGSAPGTEHGRVVCGIRREGRRQALHQAGRSREDLVALDVQRGRPSNKFTRRDFPCVSGALSARNR